ncbi:hypothetical protein BDV41DRAFT_517428 [Aspergillus transmontanensis]|uniref:Uncharacterized protein n=1 Tax=Aspergillus transmontanensis TaxID=1034304 RepID=A0A5N6WKM1_9EURO|nr:hypothetical protein BDV41DRAFT_517428 [Aspergillus transmontanensis]
MSMCEYIQLLVNNIHTWGSPVVSMKDATRRPSQIIIIAKQYKGTIRMRLHRTRPFIQCRIHQDTNSKCAHTGPPQPRPVGNYCPDHLVGRAATTIRS